MNAIEGSDEQIMAALRQALRQLITSVQALGKAIQERRSKAALTRYVERQTMQFMRSVGARPDGRHQTL